MDLDGQPLASFEQPPIEAMQFVPIDPNAQPLWAPGRDLLRDVHRPNGQAVTCDNSCPQDETLDTLDARRFKVLVGL
ncbi:MAG: hypothetical protein M3R06_07500 [Chloroflexota bacterium]|nr:hypothetical protein [Chloroflexota bacterium]